MRSIVADLACAWRGQRKAATWMTADRAAALVGALALSVVAADWLAETATQPQPMVQAMPTERGPGAGPASGEEVAAGTREIMAGGYIGVTHTHASTVTIKGPGGTDMTVRGFDWEARPFKSPIYYGLRARHWPAASRLGTMLDFTHSKAIAPFEATAAFTGTFQGKALPPQAKVGDVFKHLEFSHGHNFLTLNALTRLGGLRLQPYVGAGAGISLPHTEIGFHDEPGRTYEYQYAGLTGQVLAGLELRLGAASVFIEYKLSYSPYDVPLSGVVHGGWLLGDLWRQLSAWISGQAPPGGRATTPLLAHHAIGGVMVRVGGRQ